MKGKKELCHLLPASMQIKEIWEVPAFLHEATRQGHINNLADASLQKPWPWLVVTELSSSEFSFIVTTVEGSYIHTCNSFSAGVIKTTKIKTWKESYSDKLSSFYIMLLIHLDCPSLFIFKGQGKTAYPMFKICLLSCLLPRCFKINSDWDPAKIL